MVSEKEPRTKNNIKYFPGIPIISWEYNAKELVMQNKYYLKTMK